MRLLGRIYSKMSADELKSMMKSFAIDNSLKADCLELTPEQLRPWRDAKFGMFVHWGLYSMLGSGEWSMYNNKIPKEEYRELMDKFAPKSFDAGAWTELAKKAGMKYMVFTARHHDGFALWNSKASHEGFDSARSAAKRDFVMEYTKACRDSGLLVGIFYSLMDWRFPGYFDPMDKKESALEMKKQVYGQVEELMSGYGNIDILWYDGGWLAHKGSDADAAWLWDPIRLNKMVRQYCPNTIVNPRSGYSGDFKTQEGPSEVRGPIIYEPWEKCMTITRGSWGYNPNDKVVAANNIIKIMVQTFVRGGNFLLNVSPDADGVIPKKQQACLLEIGRWMEKNGEAVYGTRGGPLQPVDGVYGTTQKDNKVYVHIRDCEEFKNHALEFERSRLKSATMLDGSAVEVTKVKNGIKISVPEDKTDGVDTIIKLTF